GRKTRVEQNHRLGRADEPAGDGDLDALAGELAVEEAGALEPHEPVLQRVQRLHRHAAHDSTTRGERGLGYNPAHGLSADGAGGADPQGGGDPRAVLLARLLAGEGPKGGVPGGLDPGL